MELNNQYLLDHLRSIPDFPQKGINFRDVTTLFKDAKALEIMEEQLYELYKDKGITKVVGLETRGYVMGAILARRLNAGFIMARKPGKLPYKTISESYTKEYGTDSIEIHVDAIDENDDKGSVFNIIDIIKDHPRLKPTLEIILGQQIN